MGNDNGISMLENQVHLHRFSKKCVTEANNILFVLYMQLILDSRIIYSTVGRISFQTDHNAHSVWKHNVIKTVKLCYVTSEVKLIFCETLITKILTTWNHKKVWSSRSLHNSLLQLFRLGRNAQPRWRPCPTRRWGSRGGIRSEVTVGRWRQNISAVKGGTF